VLAPHITVSRIVKGKGKCTICRERSIANVELEPYHKGMCATCSSIEDNVRMTEVLMKCRVHGKSHYYAPQGKTIILKWELVDTTEVEEFQQKFPDANHNY
jgi:hypothetical protein